jgi:hypothetical protein
MANAILEYELGPIPKRGIVVGLSGYPNGGAVS